MPIQPNTATPRRAANVQNCAIALVLAPHGQWYILYTTVARVLRCTQNRSANNKPRKECVFSGELTQFCSHRHTGTLSGNRREIKYIVEMATCYSTLTKASQTANTMATRIAEIFMEYWMSNYEIPSIVLTDNRPRLTYRFFAALF